MSAQHTPGPWRAVVRANQHGVRFVAIDMPKGSRSYEKTGGLRASFDASDAANVRLMAAAPELLDALYRIAGGDLRAGDIDGPEAHLSAVIQIATDAIALATKEPK